MNSISYMDDKYQVLYELLYDKETERIIHTLDDELKEILDKFYDMLIDKDTHNWSDESEIYGRITFGEFKRVYIILLSQIIYNRNSGSFNMPMPCNIGDDVWEIYEKDTFWYERKKKLLLDDIPKYYETIFLTKDEARRICILNNARNGHFEKRNEVSA